MKFLLFLLIFFFIPIQGEAAENFCEALNLVNCEPIHKMTRRSSSKTLPSSASAAQFNPANVSHDRGGGLETFYWPGNSPTFNFVTGTGNAGAALVSSKLENAFFGNRVMELDGNYLERREEKEQYKSEKYTLALGAALFKRRNFGLDIGLLGKYNQNVKRVNPGAGLSMRMGPLSLGASVYQDDVFLKFKDYVNPQTGMPYSVDFGMESYQEKFTVQSYFAGIQIKNLFFDAGLIKTRYKLYDDDVEIKIFSASYIWKKFLFNLAYRDEESPMPKYKNGELEYESRDQAIYAGIQYSINKYIIVGLHYNYYLLDELAGSFVIFF
jgi:hypothetical protein